MIRTADSVTSDTDYTTSSGVLDSDFSDNYSEGTISRCNSIEKLKLIEGYVEENFRVDRKKLEAMILGCPPDPWDTEVMKIPIDEDGRVKSANDFFEEIMAATKTIIKFPKYLKLGARNKKDPHVRVIGLPDAVREATQRIRYELQPHNKITMKLDVSWTCHSHIIGKGGNTIQPVVKRTGVSIHFPDGNKNSEFHKSNQVSINSRGEEINGLEEARSAIRELTPLIFTFSLPATAQFISVVDTSLIIIQVQNTYNVQAELKLVCEETLFGSVKGTEWDAVRVKEATLCLLHALCGNLANQMTVQMIIEISPQHHSFILGRNSEGIRRIMQRTATRIIFPDANDPLLSPLSRSTITISGAIENVYLARQNLIGCLPLVLMFDMPIDLSLDQREANQIMQTLDVFIIDRSKRVDGRRSVVIKGAERNASNIYEAWRLVMKCGKSVPKAKIPPGYNSTDTPMCGLNQCLMGPVYCNHYSRLPCESFYQNANSSSSCCQEVLCSDSMSGESYCPLSPSNDMTTECVLLQNDLSGSDGSLFQPLSNSNECQSNDIVDVDYLINLIPDRRAPGCEKKQSAVADYITKKILATKVMKQPVLSQPRVPTSTWSGFGFSKTATPLLFSEIAKEEKMSAQNRNGWNNEKSEFNSSLNNVSENSVFKGTDQVTNGHGNNELLKRKSIDYSASNYIDSIIRRTTYTKLQNLVDVNSILAFLHLEQYIDLFASQEVDYEKFLSLNDEDLKDLGVLVYGHRRKLLMTIKELCLEQTTRNKRI